MEQKQRRNHAIRALSLGVCLALMTLTLPPLQAAAANTPVRISLPAKTTSFSALFVAQAKNYFQEYGLDLKVTVVAGIGAAQAMFSGSVEFSGLTGSEVIKSRAKGLTPILVSTWIDRMNMEIIADKAKATAAGLTADSSLQDKLRFMKGRTIGVLRTGAVAHFFLLYAARQGGLDPKKDLSIVSLGKPPALFASLQKKQIDAFVFVPPISVIPIVKGYGLRLASGPLNSFPEIYPFPYVGLLTMEKTAKKKPDLTRRMVGALVKALKFIHSNPEDTKRILKKQFKRLPAKVMDQALILVLPAHSKDGRVARAAMETAQKFLLDGGAIATPVDIDKTFTNKFIPK